MSEREEYLDRLLKGMDSSFDGEEEQGAGKGSLDILDRELEGIDEDNFLQEFEKNLGDDLDSGLETDLFGEPEGNNGLKEETGFEDENTSGDFMDNIDDIVNYAKGGNLDEGLTEDDLSIEESLKNFDEADPDLDEIGQEFGQEDSFLFDTLGEEADNDGIQDAEELSEAEKLAKEIAGLNLESDMESQRADSEEDDLDLQGEARITEEEKKPKKKGFFARLSAALFGEEEEVPQKEQASSVPADIENLSEEELGALMNLENQDTSAAEEEAKKKQEQEEKKAAKEEKAKEKAELKAQKKAAKEQKAREKAERKALKAQQQAPVEKTKPLPKKPVVLIMLFGLSIVILVNLLSGVVGYSTALSEAKDYYARGEYVTAYSCLNEKDMKKADEEFYNKVRLASYLQQQLDSFYAYQSQNMYEEALAALICGVGRYDRFAEEAAGAGVEKEYEKMIQTIETELSNNYQMSVEEARNIYALEDKTEFTYAVNDMIERLGLAEEQ